MKRTVLALSLSLSCSLLAQAQQTSTQTTAAASNQTSMAAKQAGKTIQLDSGTHLSGQLQNTVDARNARVGDQVILKTTQAIKSHGRTVVDKGSRLVGHVTEVAQASKGSGESRIGILFDRLEHGSLQVQIAATISSITGARANASANDQDVFASDMSANGSARTRSSASGSNGGLLGGVGSTVGGVVGGTTSAVGSAVNSTAGAVGNTTAGVGRSLGGIRVSQSSSASVEGSSVLSLQGQNLRLEKGTNFNLVLTESASAGTRPN
jgi:hypothetical protein